MTKAPATVKIINAQTADSK